MIYSANTLLALVIIVIMLSLALITGSTNHLISYDPALSKKQNRIKFFSSVLLSTCAIATVPLFLQMMSNNILDELKLKNLLIFTGFCSIAGFFSSRFIDDVYNKLKNLQKQVDQQNVETKTEIKQAEEKSEAVNKKLEDITETFSEIEPTRFTTEIKSTLRRNQTLNLDESNIDKLIDAFIKSKYSLRTISGLSKDANIAEDAVRQLLGYLQGIGFAEQRTGGNGLVYWKLLKYPIKIYSANYGEAGRYIDVSDKIRQMIVSDDFRGKASHEFFGIADPAPGVLKRLKIHYRFNGQEKEIDVVEGQSFTIE